MLQVGVACTPGCSTRLASSSLQSLPLGKECRLAVGSNVSSSSQQANQGTNCATSLKWVGTCGKEVSAVRPHLGVQCGSLWQLVNCPCLDCSHTSISTLQCAAHKHLQRGGVGPGVTVHNRDLVYSCCARTTPFLCKLYYSRQAPIHRPIRSAVNPLNSGLGTMECKAQLL